MAFSGDVNAHTAADPRVRDLEERVTAASGTDPATLTTELDELRSSVRTKKLSEVAADLDRAHNIQRAVEVGSVDALISTAQMRPPIIERACAGPAAGRARWRRSLGAGATGACSGWSGQQDAQPGRVAVEFGTLGLRPQGVHRKGIALKTRKDVQVHVEDLLARRLSVGQAHLVARQKPAVPPRPDPGRARVSARTPPPPSRGPGPCSVAGNPSALDRATAASM